MTSNRTPTTERICSAQTFEFGKPAEKTGYRELACTSDNVNMSKHVRTASRIQAIESWIASTFPPNQPRPAFQNTGLDSQELSSADKAVLHLVSFQMGGLL